MTDPRLVDIFPPLGLRIRSGPLELRGIGEQEVLALLDAARSGVHPPEAMPFTIPWTDVDPDELPLNYLQWWARSLALWSRDSWTLDLAVLWDGEAVGVQGVSTQDFLTLRYGETGSWLARRHQGRGIGTAMRQAMCAFLFDHLDFEFVTSAAWSDNPASLRVSEKLGYRDNGVDWRTRQGGGAVTRRLVLMPEDFVRGPAIEVEGVERLRAFIGLDADV